MLAIGIGFSTHVIPVEGVTYPKFYGHDETHASLYI